MIEPGLPELSFPEHLPVNVRRADIAAAVAARQVVIVCGETGSGKTTQLPKILLAAGRGQRGRIGLTQPRRIAAKSVAARLAQETQTRLGELIGWQVRFTDQVGAHSRVKVMTDGILLAETQSDPDFRAYDTLILDEAHERSLNVDFLLGYLKLLLPRRPDLRLVISSATLEVERFSAFFGGAEVVEVSGRTYPVEVRYLVPGAKSQKKREGMEEEPDLDAALLAAVDELAAEGPGDILVFLPGEREIRAAHEDLRKHHPAQTEILPLFARLSVSEQERVFAPHGGRRIVLATNVAETSLTVPGIRYVVDAGLARIKRYSLRNKIEQLKVEKIAQASARQRSGRCGRVAEGICIRLYEEADLASRPAYTTPELLRSSLAGVILRMKSLGLPDIAEFPFLDPPEPKRIRDGQQLLTELDALDAQDRLTAIGRQLAHLAVDPRIGRMLIAAREKGCLHDVLVIAAFLSVQDPRERPLEVQQAADEKHRRFADPNSDFISILNLWRHTDQLNAHRKSQNKFREALKAEFLSPMRVREWRDVYGQLAAQVRELGWKTSDRSAVGSRQSNPGTPEACETSTDNCQPQTDYSGLHQALMTGLLGNLGMLTEDGVYLGARDMKFLPFPGSTVKKKPKWIMAAEIVETRRIYARTLARVEPEWIEHAARHLLKVSHADPHWAKKPAHVSAAMRASLFGLPVVNGRSVHYGPIEPVLSRELFIRGALVAADWESRAPFFQHNRNLLAEIEELSHRSRDARLVVDEHAVYAFFDAVIPAGIHHGAAFDKWRRDAERKEPRLLYLTREALTGDQGDPAANGFPTEIELDGARFALAYRFEPGATDDGVTLLVPLPALNQIDAVACEWLVPGLLEEKCVALIKGLPQSLRRAFVPVPEFARAAAASLPASRPRPHDELTDAIAAFLAKATGNTVPRDAWRPDALPGHLRMNYRVQDEHGRVVAEGRDLAELRVKLGASASRELDRAARDLTRTAMTRWDFGDLPDSVELGRGRIRAFPALSLEDAGVGLKLFDRRLAADRAHPLGVARLIWLQFQDLLRQTERGLQHDLKSAGLQYALQFKGALASGLIGDVLVAATLSVLPPSARAPRGEAAFRQACETVRPRLPAAAAETARLAQDCLAAAQRVDQALARAPSSWPAVAALRTQLEALVFRGFLLAHPPERLLHLPRYLKAMESRLGKLPQHAGRDLGAMNELAPLEAFWRTKQASLDAEGREDPAVTEFRWRLEELRVSLFAQELKTPEPVSVKRLQKHWQEIAG